MISLPCRPRLHLHHRRHHHLSTDNLQQLRLQCHVAFPPPLSVNSSDIQHPLHCDSGKCRLESVAPLEAILFDIDGTLCDSDPLHFYAFRQMLQEVGFNGGIPITEEFFIENISGRDNEHLCGVLLPDWDRQRGRKFLQDKEDIFRRLTKVELLAMKGLEKLCRWIEDRGLKRGAVTNAPRSNAELLISMLGLSGVRAGVAAGMPVVGLGKRNPEKLLLEAGATFVIQDFDDPKLWTALEDLDNTKTTAISNA